MTPNQTTDPRRAYEDLVRAIHDHERAARRELALAKVEAAQEPGELIERKIAHTCGRLEELEWILRDVLLIDTGMSFSRRPPDPPKRAALHTTLKASSERAIAAGRRHPVEEDL